MQSNDIHSLMISEKQKEVINCNRFQPGSIRSSSLSQTVGQPARTVDTAAVAHAKPPGINLPGVPILVQKMLNAVKEWDMVDHPPSPPSYFNDEPRFPALGTMLKESWSPTSDVVGAFDTNWERASIRTLGEALERSCQSHPRDRIHQLEFCSFKELNNPAFDPVPFFPFSDKEIKTNEIKEMEIYWYPVETYQSRSSGLIPMRLSYLYGCEDHNVLDSIRTTNGTAIWTDKTGAIFSGLCELIERDAFFIHYLSKRTPSKICISDLNNHTSDMIRYIEKYRLEVNLFNISLEFNIPVVLCIIVDRSGVGPAISIGAKCSKDPDHAVLHALLEAVQIRFFSRMIKLRSESGFETSNMDKRSLSWYGIENIDKLDFILDSREYSKPSEFIGTARSFLDNFEHDIFVSDVTLPGLDDLFVAKVNVPQLLPLYFFDEHKPIHSDRVQRYLQDVKLNEDPHPFM